MEYPLSESLSNMDWLNPFDWWDLIMSFLEIFATFQGKLQHNFIMFYKHGYNYGIYTLPHHHAILMSPIIFLYFFIFIILLLTLGLIAGLVLCIANLFPSWIILLIVYVIFWRDPKMIAFKNITLFSAFWVFAHFFGWF
ncbi:hypothetical protein QUW35_00170 [Ligilactobacillus agilis]|uniref:hypothetical protein n=1 Tax=Ligilactobacillus agilis TaxID=1601 RepID=UPI0025A31DCC|nr:hypothetical protein [Ligilactobacillus agilis]MDM8279110.1 hypothetical protein [Ligilactobacillus agilis]